MITRDYLTILNNKTMLNYIGEANSNGLKYKVYYGLYHDEISEACNNNKDSMIVVFCGFHDFFKKNSTVASDRNMKPENKSLWLKHKNLYFYWVALSQNETTRKDEYIQMCQEQGNDYIQFIDSSLDSHWLYNRFNKNFEYA